MAGFERSLAKGNSSDWDECEGWIRVFSLSHTFACNVIAKQLLEEPVFIRAISKAHRKAWVRYRTIGLNGH